MSWDINVWHEEVGERTRLVIEAGASVPDEVIASLAGSYWLEEVQFLEPDWDEVDGDGAPDLGSHIHG